MLRRVLGEDIELVTLAAPDLELVRVDPGNLINVVLNLAIDARDAMPNGGKLTIATMSVVTGPEEAGELAGVEPGAWIRDPGQRHRRGHRHRRATAHLRAVLHDEGTR